jgi:hypothetical protein
MVLNFMFLDLRRNSKQFIFESSGVASGCVPSCLRYSQGNTLHDILGIQAFNLE